MKAARRETPSLRRSVVLNAANLGLNILFPLLSFAYAARVLGPEAMGRVGFAMAAAAIFLVLASLSLPIYGAKAVAQARDDRGALDAVFSELLILNLAASVFWSAAFLLLVAVVPEMRADWTLFLAAGSGLLWNVFHADWVFAGLEDFRTLLLRGAAVKVLTLALLPILVRDRQDALAFALLNVTAGGLSNLWGLAAALRRARPRVSGLRLRRHFRSLAAVSGSSVATGVYLQIDSVLLGLLAGPHAVGLYAAAMKVPRLGTAFLASLGTTALPRLAWHASGGEGGREAAASVREKSFALLLFLAIPAAAIGIALGPRLLEAYAGPEFAGAAGAMRLGFLLVLPAAAANLLGMQALIPNGMERILLVGSLAGAACSISANLLLIPAWGIGGSAAAAVGAELAVLAVYLRQAVSRGLPTPGPALRGAGTRLLAGLAAAGAAWGAALPFESAWTACAAGLACGGLVYFGALAAVRDEVAGEILRTVLRGRGGGDAPRRST